MDRVIEVYDDYSAVGILTRKITDGKEFDLVRRFIDFRKNDFPKDTENGLLIFVEPKVNNSYPDVLFAEYNLDQYSKWSKVRNSLEPADFKILHHLFCNGPINASSIVSEIGVPFKNLMLAIEKLYDSKLITRNRNGWYVRNKKDLSLNRIEAVEAKLNKIDIAFQQALINKTFASESYVLSNCKSINEERQSRFSSFGIGMYAPMDEGFETIRKSAASNIPVSFNSILINEWVGRVLNN